MTAKPASALSIPTHLKTVVEFEEWQRQYAPKGSYEFVRGQLIEKKAKSEAEQLISKVLVNLFSLTNAYKQGNELISETVLSIDETRIRRPDLAYFTLDQLQKSESGVIKKPRFVIELMSGAEAYQDVLDKIQDYFDAGVEQMWYVIPESRKVYVYTSPDELTGYMSNDVISATPVIPDFQFTVADLFA